MDSARDAQLAALRLADTVDVADEAAKWFVVDAKWIQAWIAWMLDTSSSCIPGPISLTAIAALSDPKMKSDFRLVNARVFELLTTWFGIEHDSPVIRWDGAGAAAIGDRNAWRVEAATRSSSSTAAVEVELLPHQHTKFCDRRQRVCTAEGKFRERETVRANVTDAASDERSIAWFRARPDGNLVERVGDDGAAEYVLAREDIGCRIRAKLVCSAHGTVVWSKPTPPVEAAPPKTILTIEGDAVVGSVLRAKSAYWGGIEGASEFWWVRVRGGKRENATERATGADAAQFALGPDDAGCRFKVKCIPRRADGMEGEVVTSKPSAKVEPTK